MFNDMMLRTSNGRGLVGYKAMYQGEKVIAIMKGSGGDNCLGVIRLDELMTLMDSGPYVNLDELNIVV